MDATLRIAGTGGFVELTVDAIAAEAGITRPVVYDLFGDLGGVLAAVVAEASERAAAQIDEALPVLGEDSAPSAMLERAFLTMLRAVRKDPAIWRLILMPPEGAPPEIRDAIARQRLDTLTRVTPLVEWGLGRLGVSGAQPAVIARVLIATAEEMGRLVLDHPRRYPPERIAGALGGLMAVLPDGIDGG
jgi:AcrR family transcriptional regulator